MAEGQKSEGQNTTSGTLSRGEAAILPPQTHTPQPAPVTTGPALAGPGGLAARVNMAKSGL